MAQKRQVRTFPSLRCALSVQDAIILRLVIMGRSPLPRVLERRLDIWWNGFSEMDLAKGWLFGEMDSAKGLSEEMDLAKALCGAYNEWMYQCVKG